MSVPLHPALVHIPLGLAFVIPALALALAWAVWTGRLGSRAWIAVVALQAALLGAGMIAMNTGEREEGRVESIVPKAALSSHEAAAEQFVWATGITFAAAALVLVFRRPALRGTLTVASVAGTLVVAAAALRVGHAGGQLVYVHNAAAAYATGTSVSSNSAQKSVPPTVRKADEDDER
jgi:uncharacterized membrane protein